MAPGARTGLNARALAARTLAGVMATGHTLDECLGEVRSTPGAAAEYALVQELCYGVLRWYPRLMFIARQLLRQPLRDADADVLALLLCGLHQMSSLRVPDHAAVSETVEAARQLGKTWATGLLNAILRRFQRERQRIEALADDNPPARFAHPDWMLTALRKDWPEHWQQIIAAGNSRPPLHLRVNRLRSSPQEYLEELRAAGLEAEHIAPQASAVRLRAPVGVEELPGFSDGLVSVQDAGAQWAAPLLAVQPGERVLDACAAPGGKTAHILELAPDLVELVAVERDASRLERVHQNLQRLALKARIVCGDASRPDGWWDGRPFDRILLDVPCSATGVIRRHPDIKVLRKPGQVGLYTRTQDGLLGAVWPLLRRGGRLLYCTCSLLHAENDARIALFRDNNKDVRVLDINGAWGIGTPCGRQAVPGLSDTDGFYYALLEKP